MTDSAKYNIELRDKNGNLREYLTPWVSGPKWVWNRMGGCGDCGLQFNKPYRDLEFYGGDDIQIRLKSGATSKLVYRGYIDQTLPRLDVQQDVTINIRGYFDKLKRIIVQDEADTKVYTNMSVSAIVEDIIDTFVTPNTSITKGTIDGATFVVDQINFKTDVATALRTLADIEGGIEYGVDANCQFFWRTESKTLNHKFFVGLDVSKFERRIDWSGMMNKIYFEGGSVDGAAYVRTAESPNSQSRYFVSEGIISNASIVTDSVAGQYIDRRLNELGLPKIKVRAYIPNTSLRLEDTIPLGKVAIYDADYDQSLYKWGTTVNGGSNLKWGRTQAGGSNAVWGGVIKAQVEKITYTLSDTDECVNMDILTGGPTMKTAVTLKQLELLTDSLRQR